MIKSKYLLMILGSVLGVAGLALFSFGSAPDKTSAATHEYRTTWTATKILTVDAYYPPVPFHPLPVWVGEAGIGVWEWVVSGEIGGTSFEETWSAPPMGGLNFTPNAGHGCGINFVDKEKILAGCFGDQHHDGSPRRVAFYLFRVREVNGYTSKIARINTGRGTQETVSCIESPRFISETECLIQSGSYNFQHLFKPGDWKSGRFLGAGTLMPLEWTVIGIIN